MAERTYTLDRRGRGLYRWTLFFELLSVPPRLVFGAFVAMLLAPIIAIPLALIAPFNPDAFINAQIYVIGVYLAIVLSAVAFGPLVASIRAVRGQTGGYSKFVTAPMGARKLSDREEHLVHNTLEVLRQQAPSNLLKPTHVYGVDSNEPNAFVLGSALFITSELFRTTYLVPVLAHELGHLNSSDGQLALALHRTTLPPAYWIARKISFIAPQVSLLSSAAGTLTGCPLGCFCSFGTLFYTLCFAAASGGVGTWLLRVPWNHYWQTREYEADAFAKRCGQASGLVEFLERYVKFQDFAVPFYDTTHPSTELRIERLLEPEEGYAYEAAAGGGTSQGPAAVHDDPSKPWLIPIPGSPGVHIYDDSAVPRPAVARRTVEVYDDSSVQRSATARGAQPGHLVLLGQGRTGLVRGTKFPLEQFNTIGRASTNSVVLNDESLSLQHVELQWKGGYWQLRDLNNDYKTTVNGVHIIGITDVNYGDRIQLGQVLLELRR